MLMDQPINKRVTILVDIIDPDDHEKLALLLHMEACGASMPWENRKWAISKTGQIMARQLQVKTPQG